MDDMDVMDDMDSRQPTTKCLSKNRPGEGDRHILLRRLRKMSQSPTVCWIGSNNFPLPAEN
jgi:2-phosphoglycerate kinase